MDKIGTFSNTQALDFLTNIPLSKSSNPNESTGKPSVELLNFTPIQTPDIQKSPHKKLNPLRTTAQNISTTNINTEDESKKILEKEKKNKKIKKKNHLIQAWEKIIQPNNSVPINVLNTSNNSIASLRESQTLIKRSLENLPVLKKHKKKPRYIGPDKRLRDTQIKETINNYVINTSLGTRLAIITKRGTPVALTSTVKYQNKAKVIKKKTNNFK